MIMKKIIKIVHMVMTVSSLTMWVISDTALRFLKQAGVKTGHSILIYGASGSVGTFSIQLGKCFGANVTAVCSTTNIDLVKSLGADQVVGPNQGSTCICGKVP
jgi:NADPH:quinone reductase-like Zn-dependent oxidoreductase